MSTILEPAVETRVEPTVREVLHRAADLLEEFGWCQLAASLDENGEAVGVDSPRWDSARKIAFCHNGAIFQAAHDLGANHILPTPLHLYVSPAAYQWNDEPGRTKADVVAKLREDAEAAS